MNQYYYILYFILFISVILNIIYIFSLYKILKKENKKPWWAFVPILNIYIYLKICKLPFWTFFVPIINYIVLLLSPFKLAKQYRLKRYLCYLAVLFPYIFIPYIAFSKLQNIDKIYDTTYIKSAKDIEILENKLETDNSNYIDEINYNTTSLISNEKNEEIINDNDIIIIDEEINFDEIIYDNVETSKITDDLIEINEPSIDNLSINNIETLEDNIIQANSVEKKIETNISEYREIKPTDTAIAFGGEQKIENIASVQTKNDELKCTRCGSSLVGANGYCPGCGSAL